MQINKPAPSTRRCRLCSRRTPASSRPMTRHPSGPDAGGRSRRDFAGIRTAGDAQGHSAHQRLPLGPVGLADVERRLSSCRSCAPTRERFPNPKEAVSPVGSMSLSPRSVGRLSTCGHDAVECLPPSQQRRGRCRAGVTLGRSIGTLPRGRHRMTIQGPPARAEAGARAGRRRPQHDRRPRPAGLRVQDPHQDPHRRTTQHGLGFRRRARALR